MQPANVATNLMPCGCAYGFSETAPKAPIAPEIKLRTNSTLQKGVHLPDSRPRLNASTIRTASHRRFAIPTSRKLGDCAAFIVRLQGLAIDSFTRIEEFTSHLSGLEGKHFPPVE
jgi:hypothetical protein